ncbi:SRPBCC family protein [Streptomyces sp. NPDC056982]|uniref:SRPBCC family protein n=1 Tax=Streptomyces sp. NPDC056982 TaxID=3345986 RepID=UPI003633458D
MPEISVDVHINRSVTEVYDFLSDARNLELWFSGVHSVAESAEPAGPGVAHVYRFPGRHRDQLLQCVAYVPGEHLVFRGDRMWNLLGAQTPMYSFTLSPRPRGTLLRLTVQSRLAGALTLLAPVVAMAWRRDLPRDVRRLGERLGAPHCHVISAPRRVRLPISAFTPAAAPTTVPPALAPPAPPRPQLRPEPRPEPRSEARPGLRPEPRSELRSEAHLEPHPGPHPGPRPASVPAAKERTPRPAA